MATKTKENTKENTFTPATGLDDDQRQGVVNTLNTVLADLHLLYTKTRNYHWNVTGPQFIMLHELFERQYNELKLAADRVAERVRMYGEPAIGTMAEFTERSRLSENPGATLSAMEMVESLMDDHEAVARQLRMDIERCTEDFEDEASADLLTALLQEHLEMAWMLRAHLA